jgi:hypothetical protein
MIDLIALVADKDAEYTLHGLLTRHQSLGIQNIASSYDIYVHPLRDPGCWNDADNFLRSFISTHRYALVLFDYEGSGRDQLIDADTMEEQLESRLQKNGWDNRCRVVVIRPELEMWVWSDSPVVDNCLGWQGRQPSLRLWLQQQRFLAKGEMKPYKPKEAVERALRHVSQPYSAAMFKQLAISVSLNRCTDRSFQRLRETLQLWFGDPGV